MAPTGDIDVSTVDFYELLAIPATASESEIRRAYRKTSRLYHPDKVTPTQETQEKFQLLQVAINILTDPDEKSKYDQTREAKQRRKAETDALEGRRRKMKEDLEKREGGTNGAFHVDRLGAQKRSWNQRELDIKRIAEENRKLREAATEQKRMDIKVQTEAAVVATEGPSDALDRSVKVRWVKEGDGLDIDENALTEMFPAGQAESVVMLKDKKRKLEGKKQKTILGIALVVFSTLSAAKKAVAKGKTDELESIEWAANKEEEPS